ncbi:MAG: ketoacyl-ACP synthase III [Lachnospiraceae bacterium]|nr:ketoacyl-ACP synthase III [Lachnospiraceae bacterium]
MIVRITGTGSMLPAKQVTNLEISQIVDTSDEWIRERTGIGARYLSTGETVASLATGACEKALEMAGRTAEEVDLILVASCSSEMLLPCSACQVQANIGARRAVAFDLNAACSGFMFALNTAYAYLQAGIYKTALIAGSEVLSKIMDWEDRGTCVLFGDGAGAVVLEADASTNAGRGLIGFVQYSDGSKGEALVCESRALHNPYYSEESKNTYVQMDGREIFKFAARQVPVTIEEVLQKTAIPKEEISYFVLHQANARIIEAIAKRLDMGLEKFPLNLDQVGNMSSASLPVLLDKLQREGRLDRGMKLVLSGFGAGLTYGACVLEW